MVLLAPIQTNTSEETGKESGKPNLAALLNLCLAELQESTQNGAVGLNNTAVSQQVGVAIQAADVKNLQDNEQMKAEPPSVVHRTNHETNHPHAGRLNWGDVTTHWTQHTTPPSAAAVDAVIVQNQQINNDIQNITNKLIVERQHASNETSLTDAQSQATLQTVQEASAITQLTAQLSNQITQAPK